MSCLLIGCLVSCLGGWLPCKPHWWLLRWLVGWLAGWLSAWLVGCLPGWQTRVVAFANLLGGCLGCWLAGWLVGWLASWLTACSLSLQTKLFCIRNRFVIVQSQWTHSCFSYKFFLPFKSLPQLPWYLTSYSNLTPPWIMPFLMAKPTFYRSIWPRNFVWVIWLICIFLPFH